MDITLPFFAAIDGSVRVRTPSRWVSASVQKIPPDSVLRQQKGGYQLGRVCPGAGSKG